MAEVIDLDDRLIGAMRDGDESALGTVIDRYTAYVGAIVWNIVNGRLSEADAKEIVSDVFYLLWRNRTKIQRGKLKAYLSSIARSKSLDALRQAKQEVSLEDDFIKLELTGPEDELAKKEEYNALINALHELPEPDRAIFIRHYYYYQSASAIAEKLKLNVNTVYTKLRRGRETLRRALTEGGYFIG